MISMLNNTKKCQAVPVIEDGIVVGVDISKRKIDFGAFYVSALFRSTSAVVNSTNSLSLLAR